MISVLTPTRARPDRLKETMKSGWDLAGVPVEFVVYVDNDDEATKQALVNFGPGPTSQHKLKVIVDEARLLTSYWNRCADVAAGNIFMLGSDDILFKTKGWGSKIELEFMNLPDKFWVLHCNNGQESSARFCTHPIMHRKWVEVAGYFTPPCFAGDYADTWIYDVAEALKRRLYLPDVQIEHMHYLFGKSEMDEVYKDRTVLEGGSDSAQQLYKDLFLLRETTVMRLKEAIAAKGVAHASA